MDFNKLKTFCVVADYESITVAASRLFRTQSAISQQITQLEEETGLALLERRASRVFLTKEGKVLYDFAKDKLMLIEGEVALLKNDSESLAGVVSIGALDEIYEYFIPDLIDGFSKIYPKVEFKVYAGCEGEMEKNMANNRIDFSFTTPPINDKQLYDATPVFCVDKICVAAPDYLKSHPKIKCFEDFINMNVIDGGASIPSLRSWLKINMPSVERKFKNKTAFIDIRGIESQKQLLVYGRGVGMAYKFSVIKELEKGTLVQILPKKAKPVSVNIYAVRKKKRTPQLIHEKFLEFSIDFVRSSNNKFSRMSEYTS